MVFVVSSSGRGVLAVLAVLIGPPRVFPLALLRFTLQILAREREAESGDGSGRGRTAR
jgi:hypothetical protein